MIFYQVLGTSAAPCCLVGTQVDAKRLARERGTDWEQVDVPTDKAGLMDYINQLKADVHAEMHGKANELSAPAYGESLVEEPRAVTEHSGGFSAAPRPAPRMFPSEPTVDLMVDMIDEGKIDARGLSNIAESIAHRFQKISEELAS